MSCTKEDIVLWLLKDRLGDLAPLVTQNLVKPKPKDRRNYMPINQTAADSRRYDISNYDAAAVCTEFLKDLIADGHIPANKAYLAIDPSKVQRARENVMTGLQLKEERKAKEEDIVGIGYDGRKDQTRVFFD